MLDVLVTLLCSRAQKAALLILRSETRCPAAACTRPLTPARHPGAIRLASHLAFPHSGHLLVPPRRQTSHSRAQPSVGPGRLTSLIRHLACFCMRVRWHRTLGSTMSSVRKPERLPSHCSNAVSVPLSSSPCVSAFFNTALSGESAFSTRHLCKAVQRDQGVIIGILIPLDAIVMANPCSA